MNNLNRSYGECWEFKNKGFCKYGSKCKFKHPGQSTAPKYDSWRSSKSKRSNDRPSKNRQNSVKASALKDVERFVKHLSTLQPSNLSKSLESSGSLWIDAWKEHHNFTSTPLKCLIEVLAKIPVSAAIDPPPVLACKKAVFRLIDLSVSSNISPKEALAVSELVHNVTIRLKQFEWDQSKEDVRDALTSILLKAEGILKKEQKDHRLTCQKLMKSVEDLERPWSIKEKRVTKSSSYYDSADEEELSASSWKNPTIKWLSTPHFFTPAQLPVMKVPDSKFRGVYEDKDDYMDTVYRLWVAMTFSDGNAALSPTCRTRGKTGMPCQQTLWPVSISSDSFQKQCRSQNCHNRAEYCCRMKNHDGLCGSCANKTKLNIKGQPGPQASTHIYDGEISHIDDTDGKVFVEKFESRNPPQHKIHWRSSKRLSCPNLVGVLKLNSHGASLTDTHVIHWGEIIAHSDQRDEPNRRNNGDLALKMSSITEFDFESFSVGDHVAIIDCMTFVPEWVPILHALEKQKLLPLPFEEGKLLNVCSEERETLSPMMHDKLNANVGTSNIPALIQDLMRDSTLEPICAIRQNPKLTGDVTTQLTKLVQSSTLDQMQLVSFIESLANPVHLTQGPPGTGKSYLGVVIVRALLILRKAWLKQTPSVGTPPILVLSYKNHAIDEFLVDLVTAEGRYNLQNKLIRIGGSCNDSRLLPFSEKVARKNNTDVIRKRDELEELHKIGTSIKKTITRITSFQSYRVDMFGDSDTDKENHIKTRNEASYAATEILLASLVRVNLLKKNLASTSEDKPFLKQYQFLGVKTESQLQTYISIKELNEIIFLLNSKIKHYKIVNAGDILYEWIRGLEPLPMCTFESKKTGESCALLSISPHPALCVNHQCRFSERAKRCEMQVVDEKLYCSRHLCEYEDCDNARIDVDQLYCKQHSCKKCLTLGLVSKIALDDPPRNVCELHPLCCNLMCLRECVPNKDYCEEHEQFLCKATTKKGNLCQNKPISRDIPYCRDHLPKFVPIIDDDDSDTESIEDSSPKPEKCIAITKKGNPCKDWSMPNSKYCYNHAPQKDILLSNSDFSEGLQSSPKNISTKTKSGTQISKADTEQSQVCEPKLEGVLGNSSIFDNEEKEGSPYQVKNTMGDDSASSDVMKQTSEPSYQTEIVADIAAISDESESLSCLDFKSAADINEERKESSPDDLSIEDEAENITHLREVFEIGCDDDSDTSIMSENLEAVTDMELQDESELVVLFEESDTAKWDWTMSIDQRWTACQLLMEYQESLLKKVSFKLKDEILRARKELHVAKTRAAAKVYENRAIIGGTMVGCITKLEAISSTKPFAILVEEASEVLEPLLFSCLCSTTCKLEMIGDHLQLQPSIMSKYDFELVNKVNISMFQRLIQAPPGHEIPSTVLSIQRRMRKSICDLTRDYYKDITSITDHENTLTQRIGTRENLCTKLIEETESKGREVPGIVPHIYLWTHNGNQERAHVGLSRVNKNEAYMICNLASYLVQCGVPRRSITILTPYKGQVMLLRQMLLKDKKYSSQKILSKYTDEKDACRISTVDRFQGDESDIVLVSLVVDKNSRTGFVQLVNRLIVLLSRARLGMYIVGNLSYFEGKTPPHWAKLLNALKEPTQVESSSSDVGLTSEEDSRVGQSIQLCCPLHRCKKTTAEGTADLKLGFCDNICTEILACGHQCNLSCHWPKAKHNTSCNVSLPSPCPHHPDNVSCSHIFKHCPPLIKGSTYKFALEHYQCPEKVSIMLKCGHSQTIPCWKETAIKEDRESLPLCNRKSPVPYIYPKCKHILDVICSMLAKFEEDPSCVPPCNEKVEYIPACGHELKNIGCEMAQKYLDGSQKHTCAKKVDIRLPRCGHDANTPCSISTMLETWKGEKCNEVGTVYESRTYGPKDFVCKEKVTYIRSCGHESEEVCGRAFEMAAQKIPCKRKVQTQNRHCGHNCKIFCNEVTLMSDMRIPEPVREWTEGSIPPIPCIMPKVLCKEKVALKRLCGHSSNLLCWQARNPPKCEEEVSIISSLCGHKIRVPCYMKKDIGIQVWFDSETVQTIKAPASQIPQNATLNPLPEHVISILNSCEEEINLVQDCGHMIRLPCSKIISHLSNPSESPCSIMIQKTLECGHTTNIECGRSDKKVSCNTEVWRDCWNFEKCRNRLPIHCSFKGKVACGWQTKWTCNNGNHSILIYQCAKGTPSSCPSCASDVLINQMKSPMQINVDIKSCFKNLSEKQVHVCTLQIEKFQRAEKDLLTKFKNYLESIDVWERQINQMHRVPIFKVLNRQTRNASEFDPKRFAKMHTMNGILAKVLNKLNIGNLESRLKGEDDTLDILVGMASVIRTSVQKKFGLDKMKPKEKKRFLHQLYHDGFDSMEYEDKGSQNVIIFDPYPLLATHRLTLTKTNIRDSIRLLNKSDQYHFSPEYISFDKPKGNMKLIQEPDVMLEENIDDSPDHNSTELASLLSTSDFEGMAFASIHPDDPLDLRDEISEKVRADLMEKMHFTNPDATPFMGIKLLETIKKSMTADKPIFSLLLALETSAHDKGSAKDHLDEYMHKIREHSLPYHPWALICSARLCDDDVLVQRLLEAFTHILPDSKELLTTSELQNIDNHEHDTEVKQSLESNSSKDGAKQLWQDLREKFPGDTNSTAMEKLLSLTGLSKVKESAVRLYKSALQLSRMSQKVREANSMATNFCFLGNPGTGKTTVARLFAEILFDSGLRGKNSILETTAQKVKDDGPDEFRKQVKGAFNGVLFIDEAYDLDPIGDFKGRPIVHELLTLCENDRDKISVILAGYEDDFNKKFYAYNPGLKSRFQEIFFEDFDEDELHKIWHDMRENKMWAEEDRVCDVVIRRMTKLANRKGFGNARSVRKQLDLTVQAAMARLGDDFTEAEMILQIEDAIGEDPLHNPKLVQLMGKVDSMIGWTRVKTCFRELLQLCSTNYRREIKGEPPLEIFLNRMFIGNPGTGKTTCAKYYGQLLKHLGFLSDGDVVSKTSSDFVGSVVGESQNKTASILDGAKGKVLIIDEAYVLDDNLYGKQVLDTLVEKVQGTPADDIAVLLLGYEDQMLHMIRHQNPGLARRFPKDYAFYFDDYSDRELDGILKLNLQKMSLTASIQFQQLALEVLRSQRCQANFGNAGAVELLLKGALQKAAQRDDNSRLEEGDIQDAGAARATKDVDPLSELHKLFKMDTIAEKLKKLRNVHQVANQEGDDKPELGHFVFTGNPGTGKTTVARVMAKILYSLDLIPSDKIVETSGLDMTADYVGQTKTKVTEYLDDAKGGILFIDEAYNLGFGHYGKEACDTLVAAMTSEKYKDLVVIIAGYSADIDNMLNGNAGLKSRFTEFFDFPDWSITDCTKFLEVKTDEKNIYLDKDVSKMLQKPLEELIQLEGWGNGRDVTKLLESALSHRASRVIGHHEIEKTLRVEDFHEAVNEMLLSRRPKKGMIMGGGNIQGNPPLCSESFDKEAPIMNREKSATTQKEDKDSLEETEEMQSEEDEEIRDDGVTDEAWEELKEAKKEQKRMQEEDAKKREVFLESIRLIEEAEIRAQKAFEEELERIQREKEAEEAAEAERKAREAEERRKEQIRLERKRLEEEERMRQEKLREERRLKEKLRQLNPCPAGFNWFKTGGGWCCAAGGHFVSDAELQKSFTS